jgi:hypothetical protein
VSVDSLNSYRAATLADLAVRGLSVHQKLAQSGVYHGYTCRDCPALLSPSSEGDKVFLTCPMCEWVQPVTGLIMLDAVEAGERSTLPHACEAPMTGAFIPAHNLCLFCATPLA